MNELSEIQDILGVRLSQTGLLEQALVHSSFVNENPGSVAGHNERLEFLGDAILGHIISDKIYRDFPDMAEGEMTRFRAALVSRAALARAARTVRLGEFLYLGKGEESSGGRGKTANLAGALEAVIAAVYLDRGEDATRQVILKLLGTEIERIGNQGIGADYKSRLQEFMQARRQAAPSYRLVSETGPDHDKSFTVTVLDGDKVMGQGTGKTKKAAETEAARVALQQLARDSRG